MNDEIQKRVLSLPSQIELRYNDKVREQIDFFINKNKTLSKQLLGRAVMYFPLIESELREAKLPDELKYLTVIESALIPNLTSPAGASGLWQFMPATAEMFGLKITNTIDERRDPVKSTKAVSKYLKKLYNIYGDWTLVLAAYNCGDGTLNNALKNTSSRSFWDIAKFLPNQTQEFIPKFIAAQYLMNYYYLHNLEPIPLNEDYVYTGTIKVNDKINLNQISEKYSIDFEVLRRLNPTYVKGFIPASSEGEYYLTLPESKIHDFINENSSYENIVAWSSASLARQNTVVNEPQVVYAEVMKQNDPIKNLPANPNPLAITTQKGIRLNEEKEAVKTVRLSKGKSLRDIAKENGTDLASIIELNKIDPTNPPKLGDPIKIKVNTI